MLLATIVFLPGTVIQLNLTGLTPKEGVPLLPLLKVSDIDLNKLFYIFLEKLIVYLVAFFVNHFIWFNGINPSTRIKSFIHYEAFATIIQPDS